MDESILLVDDDPRLLSALHRQLHDDFKLVLARDGGEALAAVGRANARQDPFAAVVCDMVMPGMDGIQILKGIKELSPHTMRIMLTGNASVKVAVEAINTGNVFRLFSKPCPAEELAKGLREAVAQYRQAAVERALLEKLGYPRSKEGHSPMPGAPDDARASLGEAPPCVGSPADEQPRPPATAAETLKDIQDMVGYDIVDHDRLVALADHVWRSVPQNRQRQLTAKDWQAAIIDKCRGALAKAEKKLSEGNPDPRVLRANVNILRSAFGRQVIRAMQDVSEYYRERQHKLSGSEAVKDR